MNRSSLRLRRFIPAYDQSTYGFNPFLQGHVPNLSVAQLTEILTGALGLSHSDDSYGVGHFSNINQEVVAAILQAHPGRIQSFQQLYDFMTDAKIDLLGKKLKFSKKKQEDAGDVTAVIRKLAGIEAMNVSDGFGIDMHDVLKTPQVVYFYLPAGISETSVKMIGKLALQSLLSAGVMRRDELAKRGVIQTSDQMHRVYLFIDEFQQLISENLEIFFRQARSMKIATIIANQTLSDLKTQKMDLTGTVMANTRLKQYFASTDLAQQKILIEASGELIDHIVSVKSERKANKTGARTTFTSLQSTTYSENVSPRLSRNHIIEASNDPGISVMHLARSDGYAQFQGYPFLMRSSFHLSRDEYIAREATPWPASNDETSLFEPSRESQPQAETEPPDSVAPKTNKFDDVFEDVVAGRQARKDKQKRTRKRP